MTRKLSWKSTHTYILDPFLPLFPQKYHPERLSFQSLISSPRLKTDSALSSKKRSKISPFSDSHSVLLELQIPPQQSLHLNCRHWDPEPNNVQIPARSHPQIILLHITQLGSSIICKYFHISVFFYKIFQPLAVQKVQPLMWHLIFSPPWQNALK